MTFVHSRIPAWSRLHLQISLTLLLFGSISGFAQIPDIPDVVNTARDAVNKGFDLISPTGSPTPIPQPQPNTSVASPNTSGSSTAYDRLNPADINVSTKGDRGTVLLELSPISKISSSMRVQAFPVKGTGMEAHLGKPEVRYCQGPQDHQFVFYVPQDRKKWEKIEEVRWVILVLNDEKIVGYATSPASLERLVPKVTDSQVTQ
jgi:hypothetical protein